MGQISSSKKRIRRRKMKITKRRKN